MSPPEGGLHNEVEHGSGLGAFLVLEASHWTLPYPTLQYPTLPYPTLPYPTLKVQLCEPRQAALERDVYRGTSLIRNTSPP